MPREADLAKFELLILVIAYDHQRAAVLHLHNHRHPFLNRTPSRSIRRIVVVPCTIIVPCAIRFPWVIFV